MKRAFRGMLDDHYPVSNGCGTIFVTAGANYGTIDAEFADLNGTTWWGRRFCLRARPRRSGPSGYRTSPARSPAHSATFRPPTTRGSTPRRWTGISSAGRLAGVLVPDVEGHFTFKPSNVPAFGAANALLKFHMDSSGVSIPTLPTEAGYPTLTKTPSAILPAPAPAASRWPSSRRPVPER